MKRIVCTALALIMCLCLFAMPAFAASASANLTGPGTVRAGDTITLTFKLSGTGLSGAQGVLSYDSNQLELKETTQKIGNGWEIEFNNGTFVAYDNTLENPINGTAELFTVKFKVKNVAAGTKITVSCTDIAASDGNADINVADAVYSATIAAPASSDNALKSLTVSNATISPAFSAGTTSYTAEVPFDVSKLDVKAEANDSKAKVSISSPNLVPGSTTKVTITVTAENGSTKTYTIAVTRAQDPNYVAGSNTDLAGITVEGFLLSPAFSLENTEYVIWLPYETENITIGATAVDSKASVTVEGGENLAAGADNVIKVICTAEDGTQKIYTIIAKRAAAHGETTDPTEPSAAPTEPQGTEPEATEPEATEPVVAPTEPQKPAETCKNSGIPVVVLVLSIVASLAVGFAAGMFVDNKYLRKR